MSKPLSEAARQVRDRLLAMLGSSEGVERVAARVAEDALRDAARKAKRHARKRNP